MKTLEATEAAADFTRVLRAVSSAHECFEIVERGVPCAYLVPAGGRGTTTHELADDLAGVELSLEDRRAYGAAIRKGRRAFKPRRRKYSA